MINWYKEEMIDEHGEPRWKIIIFKMGSVFLLFLAAFLILRFFFAEQIKSLTQVISTLDPVYISFFTLFVDTFIVPMTVDIVFPFISSWNWTFIVIYIGIPSSIAGIFGYLIGRSIRKVPFIKRIFAPMTEKSEKMIGKYGLISVLLAALTPIPFSTVCWITGILKVPFNNVWPACFARIIRMLAYYFLFKAGLSIDFL